MFGSKNHVWSSAKVGVVAALLAIGTTTVGACGSSDDSVGADADGSTYVEEAQANVDALFNGDTFSEPADDSPPAEEGARVALISVGQQSPTGALFSKYAKQANETLGWDLSIFDAEFSPDKMQEGIRQAVADNVDAIWMFAVDCPLVQTALQEAKDAGIPVINNEGIDCNQADPKAPSLFTASVDYAEGDLIDWSQALGAAQADWIIKETDGQAKVIEVAVTDLYTSNELHKGFDKEMAKCETCEIVETIDNPASNLGSKLQERVEQSLLSNPDANAMAVSYDDLMTGGVAAAIRSSGRTDDLAVIAGTGFEPAFDLIRNNQGLNAGYGAPYDYESYAGADLVNRTLAGVDPPETSGVSLGLYDADHNIPDTGDYMSPVDAQPIYEQMWSADQG